MRPGRQQQGNRHNGDALVFGERPLELREEGRRGDPEAAAQQGLQDEIDEVMVPTEEVIEIRRGKKVQTEKRFMPGYVLVKMEMTDRAYHLINSINRVTGFLGPQGKPSPMRDDEVARILNQVDEGMERPRSIITFQTGEQVNVTDGPFEGFSGMVEEVDQASIRGSRCRCRSSAGPPRSSWNSRRSPRRTDVIDVHRGRRGRASPRRPDHAT